MNLYKLVICDDEPDILTGLRDTIDWRDLGFTVSAVFTDGQGVLSYLERNEVDVILSDVIMSHVSGLDVAKWVCEQRPRTKVVLLSAYAEFALAQKAIEYKVAKYILKPTRINELKTIFEELHEQLERERAAAREAPETNEEAAQNSDHYAIEQVYDYIRTHISEGITLQEAASEVHFNPSYLSRLFKAKTGESFTDYVIRAKINHARMLLDTTHCRVYEAADAVGYRDIRYFARIFARQVGTNPSEYRKNPRRTQKQENAQ